MLEIGVKMYSLRRTEGTLDRFCIKKSGALFAF